MPSMEAWKEKEKLDDGKLVNSFKTEIENSTKIF